MKTTTGLIGRIGIVLAALIGFIAAPVAAQRDTTYHSAPLCLGAFNKGGPLAGSSRGAAISVIPQQCWDPNDIYSVSPYFLLFAGFQFDTSNTRSIGFITNSVGTAGITDPCFTEQRSTVVNLGVTNANCHVVYIPALSGTFGSTNSLQVNGTASHVRNASGQASGKLNASGGLETCRAITAGSACWGTTLITEDTGGANGVLVGLEVDVNLQNSAASYTGNAANPAGVRAVMVSSVGGAGSKGTGFTAQKLGAGLGLGQWQIGFATADSGAATGLSLGSIGTTASQGSQPFIMTWRDGSNVARTGQFNIDNSGNLVWTPPTGGGPFIISSQILLTGGRMQDVSVPLTCGASTTPTIDVSAGNNFTCNITGNVAVVLSVPNSNPSVSTRSQEITIAFRNSSGGALGTAPTFNTGAGGFKFSAVTNPANGTQVLYKFRWDPVQSFWYEVGTHLAAGL